MQSIYRNRENGWLVELIAESQGTCRYRLLGTKNQKSLQAGVIYSIAVSTFHEWHERQQPNARFWHYSSGAGYVTLTLRPGKAITIRSGGPTDEGFSYTTETYEYDVDENRIIYTAECNARDCDGPLDRVYISACQLDMLHARDLSQVFDASNWPEEHKACAGIFMPEWQKLSSSQRDAYAEAAGY